MKATQMPAFSLRFFRFSDRSFFSLSYTDREPGTGYVQRGLSRPGSFLRKQDDFFLHFLSYKEMSSFFLQKLKVVPTTLYTCFAPRWWVPNYHIIDKNILQERNLFVQISDIFCCSHSPPQFFLSAFYYPHFSIRIRHPQVSGPRFTDAP